MVHWNIQLQNPIVALHKYDASLQKYSPSEEEKNLRALEGTFVQKL